MLLPGALAVLPKSRHQPRQFEVVALHLAVLPKAPWVTPRRRASRWRKADGSDGVKWLLAARLTSRRDIRSESSRHRRLERVRQLRRRPRGIRYGIGPRYRRRVLADAGHRRQPALRRPSRRGAKHGFVGRITACLGHYRAPNVLELHDDQLSTESITRNVAARATGAPGVGGELAFKRAVEASRSPYQFGALVECVSSRRICSWRSTARRADLTH